MSKYILFHRRIDFLQNFGQMTFFLFLEINPFHNVNTVTFQKYPYKAVQRDYHLWLANRSRILNFMA